MKSRLLYPDASLTKYRSTYVNFRVNDVDKTSEDDDEVEDVPSVAEVVLRAIKLALDQSNQRLIERLKFSAELSYLESKGSQFKDEFQGEDRGEDHVEDIQRLRIDLWLPVKLHR